jgi:hypothetical protein
VALSERYNHAYKTYASRINIFFVDIYFVWRTSE